MDRISLLPQEVVLHIVSFLSAKDAASTRSVSKHFKKMITITDVVFHPPLEYNTENSFKLFADPLLALHATQRIGRVSLKLRAEDISHHRDLVREILCRVLKNGGVHDIEVLKMYSELEIDYSLPLDVFICKTLVKMSLGPGIVIQVLPENANASLPALKTLQLEAVRFDSIDDGCAFASLLSACHVLEDLFIDNFLFEEWNWSRVVSSLTLDRLTINSEFERDVWNGPETISFDTPNLTYLCYTDYAAFGYPVVNLNSLVEAHLALTRREDNIDPTNLIKGLKNVQFLSLDFHTEQLFLDFSQAVPMFENMSHLSVVTEKDTCWHGLNFLVTKSPNLKALTIEELHYEDEDVEYVCECLLGYSILASIEVLKIASFYGYIGEMAQVKHILQKLPCLELLNVRFLTHELGDEKKHQIMEDLLNLPRASSKCEVEVDYT